MGLLPGSLLFCRHENESNDEDNICGSSNVDANDDNNYIEDDDEDNDYDATMIMMANG